MPPRLLTLAIIALWLAMVGLFFHEDVWPRLAPAEPQLFPVDVVDEAGHHNLKTKYYVYKNGTSGYVTYPSWVYHPEDDSFESECEIKRGWSDEKEAPRPEGPSWLPQVHDVDMTSKYRLTRRGELKEISVKTKYNLVAGGDHGGVIEVEADVTGEPRAGQFTPHQKLAFRDLTGEEKIGPFSPRAFDRDGAWVPVTARGTVLNPLHPPRRFAELGERQRWSLTVIDPLALMGLLAPLDESMGDALRDAGISASTGAYILHARVLPEPEAISTLEGMVTCRVIRCFGDGPVSAITFWPRQRDGIVMKQEVHLLGDVWTFEWVPEGYQMRSAPPPRKAP
jgi:hypothetical protein